MSSAEGGLRLEKGGSAVTEQKKPAAQAQGEGKILLTKENLAERSGNTPRVNAAIALFFLVAMLVLFLVALLVLRLMGFGSEKGPSITPLYWGFAICTGIGLVGIVKGEIDRLRLKRAIRTGDFFLSIETLQEKYVLSGSPGSPGKKYMLAFRFHDTGSRKIIRVSENIYRNAKTKVGAKYYFVRREDRLLCDVPFPLCEYEPDEELRRLIRNPEQEEKAEETAEDAPGEDRRELP